MYSLVFSIAIKSLVSETTQIIFLGNALTYNIKELYPDIDYFIVPKAKIQDDKILEEKYCKKNKH